MTGVDASGARDEGLVRAVGPWGLGANVFNTVVGAGIFALPAALAREAGAQAVWAYVACTVMMAGVVACFAGAGSRTPTSGGPYGFTEAAFGSFWGFLAGVLVWLGSVLAAAGIAAGVADQVARAFPMMAAWWARDLLIGAMFATLAAVNAAGVRPSANLVGVMTVLKLGPIALLLLFGAAWLLAHGPAAAPAAGGGLGRAMLLAIFAFQGMETALGVSGEVRDPARSVPRGLIGAMGAIALLYMAIQGVVGGVLGPALPGSAAPLADAARIAWSPLGGVLLVGTVVSMAGYLVGDALSAPRLLFAFARDGIGPRWLGRLSPRTAAPTPAICTHLGVAFLLAVSGGFLELVLLAALASAGVYALGCAAAVVLQRRGVASAGPPLHVPGIEVAALVGIGGMGWLTLNAKPQEIGGLLVTLLASAGLYALARRGRPRAQAS